MKTRQLKDDLWVRTVHKIGLSLNDKININSIIFIFDFCVILLYFAFKYILNFLYLYVDGSDANDIPLCFIDFTSDVPKEATQVTVPSSTTNLLQVTQG